MIEADGARDVTVSRLVALGSRQAAIGVFRKTCLYAAYSDRLIEKIGNKADFAILPHPLFALLPHPRSAGVVDPAISPLGSALSGSCRSDVRVARIAARVESEDAVPIRCICAESRVRIAGGIRTHRGD